MTPRQQNVLNWISLAALATIFGAGAAWGVTNARLASLEQRIERIDTRVSAIYCQQVPVTIKDGCR